MISPKTKRHIQKIIPFGVIWLVFGVCYSLLEKSLLGNLNYYPATGNPYKFGISTIFFLLFVSISGLIAGTFEVLFLNHLFGKKSFSKKILYKSIIYLLVIIIFLIISTVISNSSSLEIGVFDDKVWDNVWTFVFSSAFAGVIAYITLMIYVSLFFSEVSENIGLLVLHNFIIGKYHNPTEEEKIFMFLDMKSSTTIAEQLGHVKYFEMLKDYYSDFSESLINHSGEIYQYVGDEIVVSWKLKSGLHNNNFLHCFYAMELSISDNAEKYKTKYGLVPSFKAGFHVGKVTTGEIGEIKKDIIFTGDVLNTTARIQGLCNTFNVDLLLSDQLKNMMVHNSEFKMKSLGNSELRGRKEKIELFTVIDHLIK